MLFDYAATARDGPVPQYVEVDLEGIRIEQTRAFGAIFLALIMSRIVVVDEFFGQTLRACRASVSFTLLACQFSIACIVGSAIALHVDAASYRRPALAHLLAVTISGFDASLDSPTLAASRPPPGGRLAPPGRGHSLPRWARVGLAARRGPGRRRAAR